MGFNDTFRFGVHAIATNSEVHVLMLKRTYGNMGWSLPGGGVDPGETIHQALLRECHEELGIVVHNVVLTGFYYHSNINAQVGIFRCDIPENEQIKLSSEHSEYKWAHISELSEVQRIRAIDAMEFQGQVISRAF
ncbi:NUDIX hydrolase [Paenibacillus aceris]|uniref:8-oxo-dGTP pyrophosphatase MutT (NUDIX family) n=1 Tax=Paenibacillus aceris TaxID=869555 RepID=A0ABS4I1C6_9BACL|nr:NUDIX domain-containing protein [Paenibacillus aceris]MBP1964221.1 8-oxo-dGTP pyrophosphatase MutT (NUDIX family) [Paenibacillus aceris]NHW36547.1 NUDIX domain-containing protein [Paenibacillus aceris]